MYINIIWKFALPALVGLFVIATVVMNSSAVGRGVARSAAADLVDCNIHDPFSPCFAGSLGYPAGDLFVPYF
jgi:predicted GNAT superfamily acetyltransferase